MQLVRKFTSGVGESTSTVASDSQGAQVEPAGSADTIVSDSKGVQVEPAAPAGRESSEGEGSGSVFRFLDSYGAGEGPANAYDDASDEDERDLAAVAALVADRAAEGMDAVPMTYEPMAVMAGPERVEEKERRRSWMQEAADMRKDIARASSRDEVKSACMALLLAMRQEMSRLMRLRHSFYALIRPMPAEYDAYEEDPLYLRDEQVCQVFWNVIAWDLVMNFVFGNAEVQTESGSFRILTIVSTAFITSITCLGCGIGCRFIFRLGNGWIDEIMNPEYDLSARDMRFAYLMLALSWVANLAVFAFCLWWSVASSRGMEKEDTEEVLIEWGLSIAFTWLLAEPIIIILMATTPFFAGDTLTRLKTMACCMFCYETVGVDVAFWGSLFL